MQKKAVEAQQEIEKTEFNEVFLNGKLEICMNGKKEILSMNISEELLDDSEMIQDILISSINKVSEKVDKFCSEKMGGVTGGMNLPF